MKSRVAMEVRPKQGAVGVGTAGGSAEQVAWFESGYPLHLTGEAMGSAALFGALHLGLDLDIEASVDSTWLANGERASILASEWWGYRPAAIRARGPLLEAPTATGTALCFTGGVDSFHNLLFGGRSIDALLYVEGYDVPLSDGERLACIERDLGEIGAATGARPIVVRTNYREVPFLREPSWERTHGAALAAAGHLLADSVGTVIISATDHHSVQRAWGSSWQLDPLWSSSRLEILHVGAELRRVEKVVALAESSLARRYLRVCWQHLNSRANCGRCEKCLRTQVMLAQAGKLDGFEAFPQDYPLEDRLDALPPIRPDAVHHWSFAAAGVPAAIEPAVRRLLTRSGSRRGRLGSLSPSGWLRRWQGRTGPPN